MQGYQGTGPINRIGLYPLPEWRDYILALWRRYGKYKDDRFEFTGSGDWWLRLSDKGVAELRKIARDLGYGNPKDRSRLSWSGVEHMLSVADRLDVGLKARRDEQDPRPMLRELAGV